MSGSNPRDKTSIMKYIPDERVDLWEFLESKGIKDFELRVILVNNERITESKSVDENDEIIVLPILKGG